MVTLYPQSQKKAAAAAAPRDSGYVLEDQTPGAGPGDTLTNLAQETLISSSPDRAKALAQAVAGDARRALFVLKELGPKPLVSLNLPFDFNDPAERNLLNQVAKLIARESFDAPFLGKLAVEVRARALKSPSGGAGWTELRLYFTPRKQDPAPATRLADRAAAVVTRVRQNAANRGGAGMRLEVDTGKFADRAQFRDFIWALNRAGGQGSDLKVSVAAADAALQSWAAAKARGEKLVLKLQTGYALSADAAALAPTVDKIEGALSRAQSEGRSAVVRVNLPADPVAHEAEMARQLYDLQVKNPGALTIKDPEHKHSTHFAAVKNVWVLDGNRPDDFVSYREAKADLRVGRYGDVSPTSNRDSERLYAKMLYLVSERPQTSRKAVWLPAANHSQETIAAVSRLKQELGVSIIAPPEVKADPRYAALFAKPSESGAVKSTFQRAISAIKGWWGRGR